MLQDAAWWFVVLIFAVLGWLSGGWRLATFCALALIGIAAMGNWDLAMDTLSQVLVAVTISVCLAIPIGIWCGRSKWLEHVAAPVARHGPGASRSSSTSFPWSSCSTSVACRA